MGMGVILESNLLAGGHVRQGQLTPVFDDERSMPVGAHHFVLPHANEQKGEGPAFLRLGRRGAERGRVPYLIPAGGQTADRGLKLINRLINFYRAR